MKFGVQRSLIRRWPIARPIACVVLLPLLAAAGGIASAAHLRARSIEPIDASFEVGDSGTIEASLDPPIQGVLRIIVQARETSAGKVRPQQHGSADPNPLESDRSSLTVEVTQWDRSIPFRLVIQSGRHNLFGSRPALLVADIDVNDLTPGVPVRVRIHSNSPDSPNFVPPDLEGHAYAVVY